MLGTIQFITKEPIKKEDIESFSVGGYSVKLPNDKVILFDWNTSSTGLIQLDDGRVVIETDLSYFDNDSYLEDNLKEGYDREDITVDLLLSGTLTEVYRHCYSGKPLTENYKEIELDLTAFILKQLDNVYNFSEQQISDYNKLYQQELKGLI